MLRQAQNISYTTMLLLTLVGVTACNRNRPGLQSPRFQDHIICIYRRCQDHIICN